MRHCQNSHAVFAAYKIKKITCIEAALSNKSGSVDISISQTHNQGSTYDIDTIKNFEHIFGEKIYTIRVITQTIDSLPYKKFDIWKLDIEGAELDAIEGASSTLQEHPPRLIIAELFDGKADAFKKAIAPTHKYAYRAGITKIDYQLALLSPEKFLEKIDLFYPISPTYVFSRSEI